MLEQLISTVKDQIGGDLQQEENLNDHQIHETMDATKESFGEAIKNQGNSGGLGDITSLFNGNKNASGGITQSAMGLLIPKLVSRLNISQDKAKSISEKIVPFVVSKFSSPETGSASNEQDLMEKLNLGKQDGLTSAMKGLFG